MNVKTRYHCEFIACNCPNLILHRESICYVCRHSKIWHSKTPKPPCDEYLSFCSSRKSARKPQYTYISPIQIAIFIPEAKAEPIRDNINSYAYCINIDSLPI